MTENNNNQAVTAIAQPVYRIRDLLDNDNTGIIEFRTSGGVMIPISLQLLRGLVKVPQGTPEPTTTDLLLFGNMCVDQRINPYLKEGWLVYIPGQGWTPVIAAQTRLRKARLQKDYDGYAWGYITDDGVRHPAGVACTVNPKQDSTVIGIWGKLFRKGMQIPFYHETFLAEYARLSERGKGSWDRRLITMILKVNRDQTHKFAYADVMGNLCTEHEMYAMRNGEYENSSDEPCEAQKLLEESTQPTAEHAPEPEPQAPEDNVQAANGGVREDTYRCEKCGSTFSAAALDCGMCPECQSSHFEQL